MCPLPSRCATSLADSPSASTAFQSAPRSMSSSAKSSLSHLQTKNSGVQPLWSVALTSAPPSKSALAVRTCLANLSAIHSSDLPFREGAMHEWCSAVRPLKSDAFTSIPASSNALQAASCPRLHAWCSAVKSRSSLCITSAPSAMRRVINSSAPTALAKSKGVRPWLSLARRSAPSSRRRRTSAKQAACAADCRRELISSSAMYAS
mmetsp:Transcript_18046/g.69844  ORF Transcript_18046/g.69844 Transcript_18046/m.69844 type:complete len:206 (-) Transcript_18046:39-656(-)